MIGGSVADGQRSRLRKLQELVVDLGRQDFERRYPGLKLSPVVALVCAHEQEATVGEVLDRIPTQVCGLEVATVVVVDGGEDGTEAVAKGSGAVTFVLPVNLGHGVALRVGYGLCAGGGARYVVTLDAGGQNDPAEMATLVQPLVDDEADFVVGSRRLGVGEAGDQCRRVGVALLAWITSRLTGCRLTDTTNGYRALRCVMLSDVVARLEQDQHQAAELLVTCIARGWRVAERPVVWHERRSGRSKNGGDFLYGLRDATVIGRTWRRELRGGPGWR